MAKRELLAGTFSATPVRVHMYPSTGAFLFLGADGAGCWLDPNYVSLLYSKEAVRAVLTAHDFRLVDESMEESMEIVSLHAPKVPAWKRPEPGVIEAALDMLSVGAWREQLHDLILEHHDVLEAYAPLTEEPVAPVAEPPEPPTSPTPPVSEPPAPTTRKRK